MTHDDVQNWLDRYVAAWKSNDPGDIGELFAEDATYRYHAYDEPVTGRDAIVADWLEEPDEPGTWDAWYKPYAVDGDRAVAVGESRYTNEDGSLRDLYYNLWTLRFDDDGRCVDFVEYFNALPDKMKASHA
jgi:ketosteroid isomerase-like protein